MSGPARRGFGAGRTMKIAACALLASTLAAVVAAPPAGAVLTNRPRSMNLAYASSAVPSGLGLSVDLATSLTLQNGCSTVATGTSAAFAVLAISAIGGARPARISVGSQQWTVSAQANFSAVAWVQLASGGFNACVPLATLKSASIQLLANAVSPSSSSPGGLIDVTARIPLEGSGSQSGDWTIPPDATPPDAAGLILQVSAPTAGELTLSSGGATVTAAVGPSVPASTFVLPYGTPTWSASSSFVDPQALLLGYVTNLTDGTDGGALLNLLPSPVTVEGAVLDVAGDAGLPAISAQIPPTGILAAVSGDDAAVEDSLAAGRQTPSGSLPGQGVDTLLSLASDGTVDFTGTTNVTLIGWLEGNVIHAPDSVDLALPGSPSLVAKPASNELTFAGQPSFAVGETLDIPVTTFTPNGLIAVVDSISAGVSDTVVTYQQGSLLDAYSEMTMVSQLPGGSPTPAGSIRTTRGRVGDAVAKLSKTFSLTFSLNRTIPITSDVSVQLSFEFAPSVTVAISVGTDWLGLPSSASMHFAVDTYTSLGATLSGSVSWNFDKSFTLGKIYLDAIDLGWVVVIPELSSTLTLDASASAGVSIGATITERSHVGMTMTVGGSRGFSFTGDSNNGFRAPQISGSGPELSIGASADAQLSLELVLAIDGVAGPDAKAEAELSVNVNPLGSPTWEVTASGDFSIGFDLDALNLGILTELLHLLGISTDPSWTIGHLGPYVVASGSGGSTGGPQGGGGGAGASEGPTGTGGSSSGGGSGAGSGAGPGTPISSAPAGASVTLAQGPAAPYGYRYAITLSGYTPNSYVGVECYDSQDTNGFYYFLIQTNGSGDASTQAYCYSATGPDYWVVAGGKASNRVQWSTSGSGPPPASAGAAIQIGWSSSYPTWIYMTFDDFPPGAYSYTCEFASGGNKSYPITISSSSETFDNGTTCYDGEFGDTVTVAIGSVQSNTLIVGGTPPAKGSGETTGGPTNTWTNYSDAGGTEGPTIPSNTTVVITCRVQGFAVADGNTWWYEVGSSPWSDTYYASADAFYNNGQTSGSLIGTPFVDSSIPVCGSSPPPPPPSTYSETTGGVANTWTNYTNAGGYEGPQIGAFETVQIECALQGFKVADGNTWWYLIASSPWNQAYYVSADPFYNNGQTSGSLIGTPFVDPNVRLCNGSSGHAETTGGATNTWTDYSDAGGSQGPTIGGNATIDVTCAVQGFAVADGNTWWYRIASSPWNGSYYASADAFYNDGQTSGSLIGTPYVDPAVPHC
jgi:hypothetical protein